MLYFAIVFGINLLITSLCIFAATKLSFVNANFPQLLIIALIFLLANLVPTVGGLLGIVIFMYLLMRTTDAEFMDCVMVVIFTTMIYVFVMLIIQHVFLVSGDVLK